MSGSVRITHNLRAKISRWPLALMFTTSTLPNGIGGVAVMFWTTVLDKYRDDTGLMMHELEHVKQFWRLALLSIPLVILLWGLSLPLGFALWPVPAHSLLYRVSKRYRLYCEVEAYRLQASSYPDDRRPIFAHYIANDYRLDIAPAAALKLLKA